MRWTLLVSLLACASAARAQNLTLKATVVTPDQVLESALVTVRGGRITGVADGGTAPDAIAIDGVDFTSTIVKTKHLNWTVMPDWTPRRYIVATPYTFSDSLLENPSLYAQTTDLTWEAVDLERGHLLVFAPKTNSTRTVPITPSLRELFEATMPKGVDRQSRVFSIPMTNRHRRTHEALHQV